MGSPGFNIELDYRFAPPDAFDSLAKQRIEEAARIWESFITDDFPDIPAGTQIQITNPQTEELQTITLDQPIDDLLIFVGAKSMSYAEGIASATNTFGSPLEARFNGNDFQPWVGFLTFNSPSNGFANLSLALHEMGHILGIGIAPIYDTLGQGGLFSGNTAKAVNGGNPIPLADDGHIDYDFYLPNGLMPVVGAGIGSGLPTIADLALLADMGYQIPVLQAGTIPSTLNYTIYGTAGDDSLFGFDGSDILLGQGGNDTLIGFSNYRDPSQLFPVSDRGDTLDGGIGNDYLQGEGGDDLLIGGAGNDTLQGGLGKDVFAFDLNSGADQIYDFTVADDVIQLASSLGFTSSAAVLQAISEPQPGTFDIGNGPVSRLFSDLTLGNGNIIQIVHDEFLKEANFQIADLSPINPDPDTNPVPLPISNPGQQLIGGNRKDRLTGLEGNDRINGKGGNDKLSGGNGNDTLIGGAGNDTLFGEAGDDLLKGGGGKDKLRGGLGSDTLVGGGDRDLFILEPGDGVDTIRGFRIAQDVFGLTQGIQPGQLTLTQQGNNTVISVGQDDLAIVVGGQADLLVQAIFVNA